MIGNNAVCNIKPVMYYRYIVGFTQNVQSSRLFVKFYPILLTTNFIIIVYFNLKGLPLLRKYLMLAEYSAYALVSWFTKDKYISSFYKYRPIIDSFPGALKQYRKMEIFAILSIISVIIFRLYSLVSIIYSFPVLFFNPELYMLYFMFLANDLGRLTMTFCFGLIYYRSKVLKMVFNAIDFNETLQNGSAVNKFIQMYETVIDTFEDVCRPLKLLVCSFY